MSQSEAGQKAPTPAKLFGRGKIPGVDNVDVVVNAYSLNVANAAQTVYKYELKFLKTVTKRKKNKDEPDTQEEKDCSRGPRNDFASQEKRRMLWDLYRIMLEDNGDFFGSGESGDSGYVYDCGINFYSIKELLKKGSPAKEFHIDMAKLSNDSKVFLGTSVVSIRAQLLAVEDINLRSQDTEDRSVAQFIDILSNQEILRRDEYLFFPSKIYKRDEDRNIPLKQEPRVLKDGMQKNVRFVGDDVSNSIPVLQIDPKKSAFFPAVPLTQFLDEFLPGNRNQTLADRLAMPGLLKNANKQIRRLVVRTTHMRHNRTFELHSLSRESAQRQRFAYNGGDVSVEEYFQTQYKIRLHYPLLPCAIEKRPRQVGGVSDSYYPLEVLEIMPGQRVSIDKQTPQLVEQMIRNCQALPEEFVRLNLAAKEDARITRNNPYFNTFGIEVADRPHQANANVLWPPAITYDRERDECDPRGYMNWKLGNRRFLMPAELNKPWVAIIFQNGVPQAPAMRFIEAYTQSARRRGMQLAPPTLYDELSYTDLGEVRNRVAFYKKNNTAFVMFFTRDKLDPVHHIMKQMEAEFEIVTQHVSWQTINKALGDRGAMMVIDNLLLKTNLKLGGINYGLAAANQLSNRIGGGTRDVIADQWLGSGRMFLGLDMSHASPQSVYERQSGQSVSEPTVVGCAYTVGHPVKMMGTYWYQQSRVTHIIPEPLKDQICKALKNYRQYADRWPMHIIVFRGGVSEGEYQSVLSMERDLGIAKAFDELQNEPGFRKPMLTIVVVQRNSNYRMVPARIVKGAKPFEQNVRAGTCLDKQVMHPEYTEFLMVSHKTIQGTAHPTRCTVICDTEPRIPLEEIENITNVLAYAHGIVLSPVSVPAPLYAASELAKRGRNNWKVKKEEEEDNYEPHGPKRQRFQLQEGQDPGHFFVDMSNQMMTTIRTKFWA